MDLAARKPAVLSGPQSNDRFLIRGWGISDFACSGQAGKSASMFWIGKESSLQSLWLGPESKNMRAPAKVARKHS